MRRRQCLRDRRLRDNLYASEALLALNSSDFRVFGSGVEAGLAGLTALNFGTPESVHNTLSLSPLRNSCELLPISFTHFGSMIIIAPVSGPPVKDLRPLSPPLARCQTRRTRRSRLVTCAGGTPEQGDVVSHSYKTPGIVTRCIKLRGTKMARPWKV